MRLAIVTGVSRGLGEATAKILMEKGLHIIGVSRSNHNLQQVADKNDVTYTHIEKDLSDLTEVDALTDALDDVLESKKVTELYLINNAAVLGPIDQAMHTKSKEFAFHVQVNTIAPIVLMNHLLRKSNEMNISFTGVTITSGAAERPVYGWSAYCSTKSSINMYTQTVGLEQTEAATGNNVIAFSPGIMDTNMQAEIRSSSEKEFKDVATFRTYKETNQLRDPKEVGQILVNLLLDTNVENGKIYYIQDYV